jgi:cardiolipin synthase
LKLYVGGPEHFGENPITNAIVQNIQSAQHTIRIANSQFNPDKRIAESIKITRKMRKVKVIGQFNGNVSKGMVVYPSRVNYGLLDYAYEYKNGGTMLHHKIQVIDDKKVIIGSYNLGNKSAYFDHEIVVIIDDERVAAKINEALDADLTKSQEYKKRHPIIQKITSIPGVLLGAIFYNFS